MSATSVAPTGSDVFGIFMILLSEALLASVNAIVKYIPSFSTQKIMIVRNPTDFCLCMAMAIYFQYRVPCVKVAGLLLVRSVAYVIFISLLWVSLRSCLPLGDVIVFVVTFAPACLVLLSRTTLGESIPSRWPIQFLLCVIGALLINKPLAPKETCPAWNALWPISAALAGAVMNFMSRNVKEEPPAIVCMFNDIVAVAFAMVTSAFGILGADSGGVRNLFPVQMDQNIALQILAGIIGCAGLMANVKGYQAVSVSATASIAGYAAVPMGYAIQTFVFEEKADVWSATGATLIVCTNVVAIVLKYYEDKKSEQAESYYLPFLDVSGGDQAGKQSAGCMGMKEKTSGIFQRLLWTTFE